MENDPASLMPESKEVQSHRFYPGIYLALDGPGSTGKTSLQGELQLILKDLVPNFTDRFRLFNIVEPPEWDQFDKLGVKHPYAQVTSGELSDPSVALPALTAYRHMMWNGAKLDGEELNPNYLELLQESTTLLLASRSPLSLVYQGIYPGSRAYDVFSPQKIGELFWTYYSWEIPFPDLLYVLIPDSRQQHVRLEKRMADAGGGVADWGDTIAKQQEVIQGFMAITDLIKDWPGVYTLQSEEVRQFPSLSLSTILAFHLICTMIEKGCLEEVIHLAAEGFTQEPWFTNYYRINTILGISAYMIPNCINNLQYFRYYDPEGSEFSIFGDIGAFPWDNNLIIVAIEVPSAIDLEFAIDQVKGSLIKQKYVELNSESRYGWRNLYSRHRMNRAWKNIVW